MIDSVVLFEEPNRVKEPYLTSFNQFTVSMLLGPTLYCEVAKPRYEAKLRNEAKLPLGS